MWLTQVIVPVTRSSLEEAQLLLRMKEVKRTLVISNDSKATELLDITSILLVKKMETMDNGHDSNSNLQVVNISISYLKRTPKDFSNKASKKLPPILFFPSFSSYSS